MTLSYRERNNIAVRKSRAAAKAIRSDINWIWRNTAVAEHKAIEEFLAGQDAALTPETKVVLRQHLFAARARARQRYTELLKRLNGD